MHRIRRLDSRVVLAAVLWLVPGGGPAAAQVMPPPEGAPTTPALTRLFDDEGKVERIASGFTFAQDVVWDGTAIVVVDGGSGRLVRIGAPATVVLQEPGVAAVAVDAEGRLIAASRGERHLVRIEEDGTRTVVVQRGADAPLAAPIDLATGIGERLLVADGASDERGWTGRVVEIAPDGSARTLVDGVGRPSGIALSPDGATLYVSDATRNELRAYALAGGVAGDARRLVSVIPWKRGVRGGPAKMTLDREGRIYLAGPGGVWVLDARGGRLGVIATPETPTSCTFGEHDGRTLFISARYSVYRVRMRVAGAAWASDAQSARLSPQPFSGRQESRRFSPDAPGGYSP